MVKRPVLSQRISVQSEQPMQPWLGILMLINRFPRPPGDIGNPSSFHPHVIFERVASANVGTVVIDRTLDEAVVDDLVQAARRLESKGVGLIATGCGFLAGAHAAVQGRIATPLASSSLMLLGPLRARFGPDASLGIITFDAKALSERHYGQWDVGPVVVEGLDEGGELFRTISDDHEKLDTERAEADAVDAARRLRDSTPDVAAVVLECTNLPPYRRAIAEAIGRPVYDVHSLIHWFTGRFPTDIGGFHTLACK